MKMSPGSLALLGLLFVAPVFAQGPPAGPPGGQAPFPGAPQPAAPGRPALPPRDPATAAAPVTGTAMLRGRVISAAGTALRRAQVSVNPATPTPSAQRRSATTDAEGRWEVTDLPAGRYMVQASKGGFVSMQYGQRRPFEPGKQIVLEDKQKLEQIDMTLQRGAAITGRLTDEFGEPVAQVAVQAMRYTYGDEGQRRLTQVASGASDDLGQFRIFGLMPGDYIVSAAAGFVIGAAGPGAAPDSFAPTYYPGTPNSDEAQSLTVALGQEANVQLQLIPSRTTRVTGVVVNSQGAPLVGMGLSLVTTTGNSMMSMSAGSTAADGSFSITSVTPGEHSISVRAPRVTEGAEFASYDFTAAGDPLTLRIVTTKGSALSGRVVWDGAASRGTGSLRVNLQRTGLLTPFFGNPTIPGSDGTIEDDGTFKLAGVSGKGLVRVSSLPTEWVIKSVTIDNVDVTDVPLDLSARPAIDDIKIVLTDKVSTLTGQVTDAKGTALKDYQVVLLPASLREGAAPQRFVRVVRPDQDGRFQVKGMPAGRYTATAVEWLEQGRQFVPEFQEQLRKAGKAVTLTDGQPTTVDLKLTEGL